MRLFAFLVSCFLGSLPLLAQTATASISGTVTDPSNAKILTAEVTATNSATGVVWRTSPDADGIFLLPALPPGRYDLTAGSQGFTSYELSGIELNVSDHRKVEIQLTVGDARESITVESSFALQTESPEIAGMITERRIRELPLNGKDFNKLVSLIPGVFATPASSNGSPVSGARTTANNYMIDGFTANFSASYLVEFPFGRNRCYFGSVNRLVDAFIGGWQLTGITTLRSGQPVNVTLGTDVNDDGSTDDRPMLLSGLSTICTRRAAQRGHNFSYPELVRYRFLERPCRLRTRFGRSPGMRYGHLGSSRSTCL